MFLIQRNIDMDIHKEPLWVDNTPVRPKPSPLLLRLLTRTTKCETMVTSTDDVEKQNG